MNKLLSVIKELLPLGALLIFIFFFRTEIAITILAIIGIVITFFMCYNKNEYIVLIFGFIMGLVFEIIGNVWLGQNWPEASFFTIPLWLPVAWGYGFIVIRRIGNILVGANDKK
jgi:hypothetical protein